MSEEAKEGEAKAEGSEEAKPKSKKTLFIIIGVVVLLVGIGVPAFLFMGGSKPADGESAEIEEQHEEERHTALLELDTIIVNLSSNSSFLKVKIVIEYDTVIANKASGHGHGKEGAGGGGGKDPLAAAGAIGHRMTQISDAILSILSAKKPEDVLTPEGKDELKQQLIEAINEAIGLDEGPVLNIYFKEFIIQ